MATPATTKPRIVTAAPRIVGIVGSEGAKFTNVTEAKARAMIRELIVGADKVVSGACHLGGIDVWAIEEAKARGIPTQEFPPRILQWAGGYRERNVLIARTSTEVFCLTLRELPPEFGGMRFPYCYHCNTKEHVKSGGCWTTKYARSLGKPGTTLVIS
jgi:hypothetical protein